jgi:hypothetical protein
VGFFSVAPRHALCVKLEARIHLATLLAAMSRDFATARSNAGKK